MTEWNYDKLKREKKVLDKRLDQVEKELNKNLSTMTLEVEKIRHAVRVKWDVTTFDFGAQAGACMTTWLATLPERHTIEYPTTWLDALVDHAQNAGCRSPFLWKKLLFWFVRQWAKKHEYEAHWTKKDARHYFPGVKLPELNEPGNHFSIWW
jgi:hypothetical protein